MDLRNIHLQQKKQHSHGFSLTQQLFLALREKILSQQLLVGSRLPASRLLAKDLGVSRNTVNSVYEQLRAEGYVNSREGSGFYISEQLPQLDRRPHIAKGKPVQDWPPPVGLWPSAAQALSRAWFKAKGHCQFALLCRFAGFSGIPG